MSTIVKNFMSLNIFIKKHNILYQPTPQGSVLVQFWLPLCMCYSMCLNDYSHANLLFSLLFPLYIYIYIYRHTHIHTQLQLMTFIL